MNKITRFARTFGLAFALAAAIGTTSGAASACGGGYEYDFEPADVPALESEDIYYPVEVDEETTNQAVASFDTIRSAILRSIQM